MTMKVYELLESPSMIAHYHSAYDDIVDIATKFLEHNHATKHRDGFFSIKTSKGAVYWYGGVKELRHNDIPQIDLGIQVNLRNGVNKIIAVGRMPGTDGRKPYASDLYVDVVKTTGIPLQSGSMQTKHALNVWKRLVKAGHKVSILSGWSPHEVIMVAKYLKDIDKTREFRFGDSIFQLDP